MPLFLSYYFSFSFLSLLPPVANSSIKFTTRYAAIEMLMEATLKLVHAVRLMPKPRKTWKNIRQTGRRHRLGQNMTPQCIRRPFVHNFRSDHICSSEVPPPISPVDQLKTHRASQAAALLKIGVRSDLVFANSEGAPIMRKNLVRRHFKATIRAAALPANLSLYCVRHTCASLHTN